jgi:hypothetical protein
MKRLNLLGILVSLCLSLGTGTAVLAIGDASNPVALSSKEVSGSEEPKGQSHYYSFVAGPGDVTVKVGGATDFYSTVMRVVLRDSAGKELTNLSWSAGSDDSMKAAAVHLNSRQTLTMQLMFGVDVGVRLKYKVLLDGTGFGQNNSMLAENTAERKPPSRQETTTIKVAAQPEEKSTPRVIERTSTTTTISIPDKPVSSDDALNKPIDDKWALVIGISKFQKPEINLKYPAKDAADLRDFRVKEANFAPDHVKLLVDDQATKSNVMAQIGDKWLPHNAQPNDLVLIFISTHGSPSSSDLEGLNYLVMHDTDPGSLYATGLPLQDLAAAVKQRVHSNRVVLIVDACHSGAANPAKGLTRIGNFDSNSLLLGTGQLVICSSEPSQVSWESKRYENGVFTHNLIQALRSKGGNITLGDAFAQMKNSVVSEVLKDRGELQSPVMKTHWKGNDLILSAPPSRPH